MAFHIHQEQPTGAIATYAHISSYEVQAVDGVIDAHLRSYLDEEARRAGKVAMWAYTVRISFAELGIAANQSPTREQLYDHLKLMALDAQAGDPLAVLADATDL